MYIEAEYSSHVEGSPDPILIAADEIATAIAWDPSGGAFDITINVDPGWGDPPEVVKLSESPERARSVWSEVQSQIFAGEIKKAARIEYENDAGNRTWYELRPVRHSFIFGADKARQGDGFSALAGIKPYKILEYKTAATAWEWWEDLRDNLPEDLPTPGEITGKEWDAFNCSRLPLAHPGGVIHEAILNSAGGDFEAHPVSLDKYRALIAYIREGATQ